MHVDELRARVYALMAFEGVDYAKFSEVNTRDVGFDVYQKHKDKLPP